MSCPGPGHLLSAPSHWLIHCMLRCAGNPCRATCNAASSLFHQLPGDAASGYRQCTRTCLPPKEMHRMPLSTWAGELHASWVAGVGSLPLLQVLTARCCSPAACQRMRAQERPAQLLSAGQTGRGHAASTGKPSMPLPCVLHTTAGRKPASILQGGRLKELARCPARLLWCSKQSHSLTLRHRQQVPPGFTLFCF